MILEKQGVVSFHHFFPHLFFGFLLGIAAISSSLLVCWCQRGCVHPHLTLGCNPWLCLVLVTPVVPDPPGGVSSPCGSCVLLAGAQSLWARTSLLWGLSSGLDFSREPWFFWWVARAPAQQCAGHQTLPAARFLQLGFFLPSLSLFQIHHPELAQVRGWRVCSSQDWGRESLEVRMQRPRGGGRSILGMSLPAPPSCRPRGPCGCGCFSQSPAPGPGAAEGLTFQRADGEARSPFSWRQGGCLGA